MTSTPLAQPHGLIDADRSPEQAPGRAWALTGAAAAVLTMGGLVVQGTMNAAFDPATSGDADAILDSILGTKANAAVFHVLVASAAMLLVPFAAGLHRRLRSATTAGALAPAVAAAGVLLTSVALLMGSALDTEFGIFVPDRGEVVAENVSLYNHWIGTVPCLWVGAGLAGVAVFVVARSGGVPRWIGLAGLLLGGFTLIIGISPLQYIAGASGPLWMALTAAGFAFGDKAHRAG